MTINLSRTEISHLLYLLEVNKRDEWWVGNREQYEKKAGAIQNKLLRAFEKERHLTGLHRDKMPTRRYEAFAEWTDVECPKCKHSFVARDKFGLYCCMLGCNWHKNEPKQCPYCGNPLKEN